MPNDQRRPGGQRLRQCAICRKDAPNGDYCEDCTRQAQAGRRLLAGDQYSKYVSGGSTAAEYIAEWPNQIAATFAMGRPKLTKHQLRAFYSEVKRTEAAYRARGNREFDSIYKNLVKLKPAVEARLARGKVPVEFRTFINRNVDATASGGPGFERFVDHFESVVAYCEGKLKDGQ